MYLHQELRWVAETRQTEALKRIHWLHSLMSIQPGFIRTLACRYLGSPDRYAWLRFWTSPAGNTDFRQTDEAKQFAATRPEGLYGPLPGGIADSGHWHSILESEGKELGDFLVRSAFRVSDGDDEEFITNRQEHQKMVLEIPGIMSTVTLRCNEAGSENIYLTFLRTLDREAFNNLLESQSLAGFREQQRPGLYETLTTECYLIVDELLPGSPGASQPAR